MMILRILYLILILCCLGCRSDNYSQRTEFYQIDGGRILDGQLRFNQDSVLAFEYRTFRTDEAWPIAFVDHYFELPGQMMSCADYPEDAPGLFTVVELDRVGNSIRRRVTFDLTDQDVSSLHGGHIGIRHNLSEGCNASLLELNLMD